MPILSPTYAPKPHASETSVNRHAPVVKDPHRLLHGSAPVVLHLRLGKALDAGGHHEVDEAVVVEVAERGAAGRHGLEAGRRVTALEAQRAGVAPQGSVAVPREHVRVGEVVVVAVVDRRGVHRRFFPKAASFGSVNTRFPNL